MCRNTRPRATSDAIECRSRQLSGGADNEEGGTYAGGGDDAAAPADSGEHEEGSWNGDGNNMDGGSEDMTGGGADNELAIPAHDDQLIKSTETMTP